ncbi:MAG: hypothetical protein ACE5F5_06295 [Acidimicrobiia bacterium]
MTEPLAHLVRRFFDVLFARPLTATERAAVRSWLDPEMSRLFFDQASHDQRHGYLAALAVLAAGRAEPETIAAALMHDVGKRHARLGVVGRSVASILVRLRLPLTERMKIYRDHGLHAARELAEVGAPALVVAFALHHHGSRPPSIAPGTWEALKDADQPAKSRLGWTRGITSAPR